MHRFNRIAAAVALIVGVIGVTGITAGGPASAATPDPGVPSTATLVAPDSDTPSLDEQRRSPAQESRVDAQIILCWRNVTIRASANNLYVTTVLDEGGRLRARTGATGPWELYQVCRNTSSKLTNILAQANTRLVSTEIGAGGTLRARTPLSAAGPWELYYTGANPGGSTTVIQSYASTLYTSTELGDGGSLRARSGTIGLWEVYSW
jgi:hypothetical protein